MEKEFELPENDMFRFMSIENVNFKPHRFVIGVQHITHAAKYHGGSLGEETAKKIGCAFPNCNTPFEQHTSDKVLFLQLKRNATEDEANKFFQSIVDQMTEFKIDGFCLVDTDEKFRVI